MRITAKQLLGLCDLIWLVFPPVVLENINYPNPMILFYVPKQKTGNFGEFCKIS